MHAPQLTGLRVSLAALVSIAGLALGAVMVDAQEAAPAAPAAPAAAAPADAAAPAAGDVATVSFPAAQIRRGTPLFNDNCAACHGARLEGVLDGPPLAGANFQAAWFGQPVSALYEFTSTNMPQDRPGALTPEQYADIVAFILKKNGIDATDGATDLPGDATALASMMLPAPAAK